MSKHVVDGGNVAELLDRFEELQQKARLRTGKSFPIVTNQEAGLDGFLDTSRAGSERDRELLCRFDRDVTSTPACEDRQD